MSILKLTYLNLRARAEPIRFMLAYGDISYEDKVISTSDWKTYKHDSSVCHFSQLPSLTTSNGILINQSGAIARYVAKLIKVYPEDIEKAAIADMIFELAQEMNPISPVLNFYSPGSETFEKTKRFISNKNWSSTTNSWRSKLFRWRFTFIR